MSAPPRPPARPARRPPARPGLGILCKLGSVAGFVALSIIVKATAGAVPPGEQVFFRAAFAIPVTLLWLAARGALRTGLRVRSRGGHVLRGVVGTGAMALMFMALGRLPLPEATAINYATPILITLLAALLLGERLRAFRLAAVMLGMTGVLVILAPRFSGLGGRAEAVGAMLALGGAFLAALAQIQIRRLTATESTSAIVFWFSCTAAALALLSAPFGWVWPAPRVAGLLVAAGLVGGVAQILLTSAYRFAPASVIAPFEYASMLLAVAAGYRLFGEVPTPAALGGGAIVILAGGLILWRERALGIERARPARAGTPGT